MKRALKKRVKAVLKNNPSNDEAPVEHLNVINPKVNRRARTQAAMIGLAISMGATSLLVTRQSDQAQAADPVGSQKAASTIPAATEPEVKFATTKLESSAVSSASVPENPVIVEPTAVSQVPGLEAKWQIAANGMAVQVPASEAISRLKVADKNAVYLQPQVPQGLNNTIVQGTIPTTNNLSEKLQQFSSPKVVAGDKTTSLTVEAANTASSEVNAQLKAQQEFALNRLQEKSNRLRNSLAQLQSGETKNLSQPGIGLAQPKTVVKNAVIAQPESITDGSKSSLISRLKQNQETSAAMQQLPTLAPATPKVAPSSAPTAYEVKPGDTLAAIAKNYGTSVSELIKSNNLDNPNQLQINQKLIIPVAGLERSTVKEPTVAIKPTVVQSNGTWTVATPSINANAASVSANQPVASQLPVIANNSNVTVPTQVAANNQIQVNTATAIRAIAPETAPTPDNSYGVGGDTPVPKAFTEYQLAQKPTQKVAQGKSNERLRSLQAEIERLRQKYRAQQSGIATPEVTEIGTAANDSDSVAIQIPVVRTSNFTESRPFTQRNAVQIPVPQPILPTYSAQPMKPLFRATQPTNEPINPEFLPNQAASGWTPYRNPSRPRLATPPRGVNAADSLGKMRGTTVSPQLPPLAAVDQYLPRAIDPAATPNPSSFSTAYIWPAKGVLTSGYGWRWGRMHKGIDIANSTGTPIYAASEGVVEKAGWNNGGYGNLVDIRHPDGSLTRYGHNSRILVQVGQQVQQGQTIAAMGSTGFSTGPHTHFEVHPAGKKAVNPIAFLPARL
ncbi:peptidoglycan DD-metalloendopeptidase family protein [Cylindrospermum sp. FACHB-282]|uniref:peptidoglycan DD-metalloendopeptidase family protein n=1 Tax=Cylindrospermum sp. FACHB-282 TaxID=2692794 RepID=UPI0016867DE7|nr:peptidoglycan DD-metalloendopeptidase family protein [Cylindrospermum sp. FACHB-282]MBD2388537.1 peptidoglycan DD-metalloendopeptidase family protein [Cylindrospermum sp. FACHB-282]